MAKTAKPKTQRKRKYLKPRIPRKRVTAENQVMKFTRLGARGSHTTTSGVSAVGLDYHLTTLPDITDFTALFDQFRIRAVKTTISLRPNEVAVDDSNNSNLFGLPEMYYYVDYDDAVAPSYTTIRQRANVKRHFFGSGKGERHKSVYLKPRYRNVIGDVTVFGAAAKAIGKYGAWLDLDNAASQAMPHYGLKIFLEVPQSTGTKVNVSFDTETKYYLEFRNSR